MTPPEAASRRLWLATLVYAAFIVYGSLVPLEFRYIPWDQALARFSAIPLLKLGVGSRADLIANLILYLPFGFLLRGALSGHTESIAAQIMRALLAAISVGGLALAVEFTQEFFPQRTVSLNDLYSESIGGVLGIVLWILSGRHFISLGDRFRAGGRQALRATLWAYALAYLFLSLFPYDFLLNAREWHAHITRSGYTGWVFANACGAGCESRLGVELLAALPFGLLLRALSAPRRVSIPVALAAGAVLGLTIEGLQLFLASGISQGASVASRALGVALGVCLPGWAAHWNRNRMRPWIQIALVLGVLPYLVLLALVNHWFYSRWLDASAAWARLSEIRFLPFYYHYYTSEAVALVSLIFQVGLYAPVGAGLWLWRWIKLRRALSPWVAALLAATIAALIETGKLFVASQHPDPSNVLIALAAAAGAQMLLAWLFPPVVHAAVAAAAAKPVAHPPSTEIRAAAANPASQHARNAPPARLLALGLLVAGLASVWGYPLGWMPVALLLVLASLCWRWPGSWLIVVPAALPLLDESTLTGRLFWNEFDTLVLLVLAASYARSRVRPAQSWPGRWPLALYGVSVLSSLLIGLFPLAPLDLNAFSHYTSPYHALDAVKGFACALLFIPLIKSEWHKNPQRLVSWLALGMSLGLAFELMYVLWERVTFSGLLNFDTDFRITGTFPAINIGGASIEAYLVLASPFVWLWAWVNRGVLAILIAGVVYALAAYGVMVTFSRGGQGAFALSAPLLLLGFIVLLRKNRLRAASGGLVLLVAVVLAGLVAWPIISGKFSQSRLATTQADFKVRLAHWQDTLSILQQSGNPLIGAGSGAFARDYYWYSSAPERPSTYTFVHENGNALLRLRGGETLYFEQQVGVEPGHVYRLQLDLRSTAKTGLTVTVCEKALLYSFTCVWNTVKIAAADNRWQHAELLIRTKDFNQAHSLFQRPVKLSLFNQDKRSAIDVDNVALIDEHGHDLIHNGDFTHGMQHWFFSTDSHLARHAKNLFIHVLFEQGWLGLAAFMVLLAITISALLRRMTHDALALTVLVSFTAFLIVGVIDSLIDDPRLDFLFFWLLLIALITSGKPRLQRRHRPPSREPSMIPNDEDSVIRHS